MAYVFLFHISHYCLQKKGYHLVTNNLLKLIPLWRYWPGYFMQMLWDYVTHIMPLFCHISFDPTGKVENIISRSCDLRWFQTSIIHRLGKMIILWGYWRSHFHVNFVGSYSVIIEFILQWLMWSKYGFHFQCFSDRCTISQPGNNIRKLVSMENWIGEPIKDWSDLGLDI